MKKKQKNSQFHGHASPQSGSLELVWRYPRAVKSLFNKGLGLSNLAFRYRFDDWSSKGFPAKVRTIVGKPDN